MHNPAEQVIFLHIPSDYHITSVALYPDKEELHLSVADDWCNALHSQLKGQVLSNTEGHQPILYDMPARPPENNVIILESSVEELLKITKYLEEFPHCKFLSQGTHQALIDKLQSSPKRYIGEFFERSRDGQSSDEQNGDVNDSDAMYKCDTK